MRLVRALVIAAFAGWLAMPAASQQGPVFSSPVLTLDQERLFTGSKYGQSFQDALEAEGAALAAENRTIEAELLAEERKLTEERKTLDPAEFRALATAFDEKVVSIRTAQDEKARQLVQRGESERARFYQEILPVVTEIVRERGAVAVLERRTVILSADNVDITAEAIERIDTQFGPQQGETPATPDKN